MWRIGFGETDREFRGLLLVEGFGRREILGVLVDAFGRREILGVLFEGFGRNPA